MKKRFLILAARFNELVVNSLVSGAERSLNAAGVVASDINLVWVPGAYELPVVAARAARSGKYSAVICLGAVIRGETPHFEYVAGPCSSGLMSVGIETGVPVIFGVLTTDTVEQASNRAGLKYGNKGADAASTAIEVLRSIESVEAWS